jgi:hypothetical protein
MNFWMKLNTLLFGRLPKIPGYHWRMKYPGETGLFDDRDGKQIASIIGGDVWDHRDSSFSKWETREQAAEWIRSKTVL